MSFLNYVSAKRTFASITKESISEKENEARREEELKNKKLIESIPNLHDQIENLKEALYRKEEELKRFEEDTEILKDLHKQGYIDDEGNPIVRD